MKSYHFIGDPALIPTGIPPVRIDITDRDLLRLFVVEEGEVEGFDLEGCLTVTYIVDEEGQFWVTSRRSEHVACARGKRVLAAREVSFRLEDDVPVVVYLTNQSTGYCPEPQCWEAVEAALEKSGLEYPSEFERAFDFRRCEECGTLVVLKDDFQDTCLECGKSLPEHWNLDSDGKRR